MMYMCEKLLIFLQRRQAGFHVEVELFNKERKASACMRMCVQIHIYACVSVRVDPYACACVPKLLSLGLTRGVLAKLRQPALDILECASL